MQRVHNYILSRQHLEKTISLTLIFAHEILKSIGIYSSGATTVPTLVTITKELENQ